MQRPYSDKATGLIWTITEFVKDPAIVRFSQTPFGVAIHRGGGRFGAVSGELVGFLTRIGKKAPTLEGLEIVAHDPPKDLYYFSLPPLCPT
jgi:hypothetical protein